MKRVFKITSSNLSDQIYCHNLCILFKHIAKKTSNNQLVMFRK